MKDGDKGHMLGDKNLKLEGAPGLGQVKHQLDVHVHLSTVPGPGLRFQHIFMEARLNVLHSLVHAPLQVIYV